MSPYCKECTKKKSEDWRFANPEQFSILSKRKNKAPKEVMKKREYSRQQQENGKYKKWLQNNPDKVKEYNLKKSHKKHKINKREWELCKRYFGYKCAYCGLPLTEHYYTRDGIIKLGDFHKEHVNHKGSNDLSNCVPSCGVCNSEKWTKEFDEWYNKDNSKFTEERYNRIIQWLHSDWELYIDD